jgi:chromate transporter
VNPLGALRVFWIFLSLGCRSFGGPIAHLALFRHEFVTRRAWLDERAYADHVALCQFLPGPSSSQVGMLLGWGQAGLSGLLAAWLGFTLPGALLLIAAGLCLPALDPIILAPCVHGMQIAVLAIVAGAVTAMWRQICSDHWRGGLALVTASAVLAEPQTWMQLPILALAGLAGCVLPLRASTPMAEVPQRQPGRTTIWVCALLFTAGLLLLPLLATPWSQTAADLFRTGSLVVGGGHVVLPLLATDVVDSGRLPASTFLAGYGLVQALPGPMFNIAAFLGAAMHGSGWSGVLGGILAVVAIFLPGALLVLVALPAWHAMRRSPALRRVADGLCAGVVGLLIAALYDPIATSAIQAPRDAALACLALAALLLRAPPWLLVPACAGLGWLFSGS